MEQGACLGSTEPETPVSAKLLPKALFVGCGLLVAQPLLSLFFPQI